MRFSSLKYSLLIVKLGFRKSWKALIVLVTGLLITLVTTLYSGHYEVVTRKKAFSFVCDEIKTKISTRLHSYAFLLRSGSAYVASSDTVSRKEWKTFIERTKISKNLPGIQGVGYSILIEPNQLNIHIRQIKGEGFPDYSVKPEGKREKYSSIIFIEPFSGRNLRAFGYDMLSENVRRKAMEQSCDSDLAVMSGKVVLMQENKSDLQSGTLMYVPVYQNGLPISTISERRAALKGWVYSPFRMNDLMTGVLGHWDLDNNDRILLQVYDETINPDSKLFDSSSNLTADIGNPPSRTNTLTMDFNGKRWILYFKQFREPYYLSSKVIMLLISGTLISFLLMALSLSMFNTFDKAQQIANQSTRNLKESEERFKMLLNSTAEAIFGLDRKGNCTFSNRACLEILGYENSDQLLGKNMHNLIHHTHPDGRPYDIGDCPIHKAFIEGLFTHVDNEVLWRRDGSWFHTEYWSYPLILNGKNTGAVVTFLDITERIQSIEKINSARNEAEKANLAKSEFLSRMSHELRTPMNSILGFAQLLQMGHLQPRQQNGVGHILQSGKHLLDLINEVLDISRIEAGHLSLSLEPVLVDELITELIDSIQPLAFAREIRIHLVNSVSEHLFVKSDRVRLKQVLMNLINNAIKYNRTKGAVTIDIQRITSDIQNTAKIRISVADTGIGISSEDIPKLFTPFERIGAEKTQTEGTGLGLMVVKKLLEAMGGIVGVVSTPGKGSTFWIELPQSASPLENVENENDKFTDPLVHSDKTGTILYIEDNRSNIELVEQILELQRSRIRLISNMNGRKAVELAIIYKPDLILLDLNLPDIQGDQVILNLRTENRTKNIPVVVISADAMPAQREKLLKSGARNYLSKPLDVNSFLEEVDKWVLGPHKIEKEVE